jgi:hypothetical protein
MLRNSEGPQHRFVLKVPHRSPLVLLIKGNTEMDMTVDIGGMLLTYLENNLS